MELEEYRRVAEAEDRHWWYRTMPDLLEVMLGASLRPGLRILDAGCGPGANFGFLGRYGDVVGIDASPLAIELAAERHPEVATHLGDITELPFADSSFDLAIEITVLYSVPDDALAVAELARVLRPGGTVLLMEPAHPSLRRAHDEVVGSLRRYRRAGVAELARRAGLEVRRSTYVNSFLLPPAAVLAAAARVRRPSADSTSDLERGSLDPLFIRLSAAERAVLRRRDVPLGLQAMVVAQRPAP